MPKAAYKSLTLLGTHGKLPMSPAEAKLEMIPKPFSQYDYHIRFTCPQFTSLCPITGQPDFAHVVIDYVPNKQVLESKSLKLFLQSFRNHADFVEVCSLMIGDRLLKGLKPKWIRVSVYWYPRGGIPIDVFFERGKLPKGVTVPETGVAPYRGRG